MKKILLFGSFATIVMLNLISSVFASCYSVQQNGWCPALTCPQPPQYLYGIYSGDGETSTLGCVAGKWTCLTEYCPSVGTCSCISEPAWWMYTSGATGSNDGNSDVCNGVSASEGSIVEICWGGTTMGDMDFPNGWDADEKEAVFACYVGESESASGIDTQTLQIDSEPTEVSTQIDYVGTVSGIELPEETTSETFPLHWKAITFDGTNTVYPIGTPQPHDFCIYEQKNYCIGTECYPYFVWDCLEPWIWSSNPAYAVCEYATCEANIKCDNLHPYTGLGKCTDYGQSYFADGCTIDCMVDEDSSTCRSSAYASDCTADSACNGVAPGTNGCTNDCKKIITTTTTRPTTTTTRPTTTTTRTTTTTTTTILPGCSSAGGRCMSGSGGCIRYCQRLGKEGYCELDYPGCTSNNCCCFCF